MKRLTAVTVLFAFGTMIGVGPAFAQYCPMGKKMIKGEKQGKHMKSGMHGKVMKKRMGKKGMPGMMQGGMNAREVIPTEDGGIVVKLGNKLIKYDSDMEKVGEATIEITKEDIEQRMQHMQEMREACEEMWEEQDEE